MPLRASRIDPMAENRSQTPKVGGGRAEPSTLPSAPGNEDVKIRDFETEEQQSKVDHRRKESSTHSEQEKVASSGPFKVLVVEVSASALLLNFPSD